jgi:hypothetical protein
MCIHYLTNKLRVDDLLNDACAHYVSCLVFSEKLNVSSKYYTFLIVIYFMYSYFGRMRKK